MKKFIFITCLVLFLIQPAQATNSPLDGVNSVLNSKKLNLVCDNCGEKVYYNKTYYEVDTKINLIQHTVNMYPRYVTECNKIINVLTGVK